MNEEFVEENPLKNEKAEEAVLGGCIQKSGTLVDVAIEAGCTDEWFTTEERQTLWNCIIEMKEANRNIDMVTIQDWAKGKGVLEKIVFMLEKCVESFLTEAFFGSYIDILRDKYNKRRLGEILHDHASKLESVDTVVDVLSSLKFDVDGLGIKPEERQPPEMVMDGMIQRFKQAQSTGFINLPSRWIQLQRKTGGYVKRKVCVVAARPGQGKSTFMCNEALNLAENGYPVGIVSLEMDEEEIYAKMVCDRAGLDLFKLTSGNGTDEEIEKFRQVMNLILQLPIYVTDRPMDIRHICNWVRVMCHQKHLSAVFIDYVQLISQGTDERKARSEVVSNWSKQIAQTTKKCNVATILLAQINRGAEPPPNVKPEEISKYYPRLWHLKESGALEEDAFQVILLYAQTFGSQDYDNVPYFIEVAKARLARIGKIEMSFQKAKQHFAPRFDMQPKLPSTEE